MKLVSRKLIKKAQFGTPLNINTSSTTNLWNTSNLINQQMQQLQTPTVQPQVLNKNPNMYTVPSVGSGLQVAMQNYNSTNQNLINSGVGGGIKGSVKDGGYGKVMGSKGASVAGGAIAGMYDVIPTADKVMNSKDKTSADIRGAANKALLSGAAGPWGMLAGAVNTVIDKTGGFTDASEGLGKGTDTANMIASLAIPGAGWFTKKTEKYKMSDALKQSSGYTGTAATGVTAQQNAGAKLLFGKRKANNMIREQKRKDNMVQDILSDAQDDFAASNNPLAYNRMQMSRTGGFQATAIGREGIKIFSKDDLEKARNILNGVQRFQDGGKMNVIPEGALHARKHNMELDEITKKGIPVVTEKSDGGLIQQAEIERDEIIFNLEVTKKLEELMKAGTDEAAIEAGKLLVQEILHNTQDNTGLINEVQ